MSGTLARVLVANPRTRAAIVTRLSGTLIQVLTSVTVVPDQTSTRVRVWLDQTGAVVPAVVTVTAVVRLTPFACVQRRTQTAVLGVIRTRHTGAAVIARARRTDGHHLALSAEILLRTATVVIVDQIQTRPSVHARFTRAVVDIHLTVLALPTLQANTDVVSWIQTGARLRVLQQARVRVAGHDDPLAVPARVSRPTLAAVVLEAIDAAGRVLTGVVDAVVRALVALRTPPALHTLAAVLVPFVHAERIPRTPVDLADVTSVATGFYGNPLHPDAGLVCIGIEVVKPLVI